MSDIGSSDPAPSAGSDAFPGIDAAAAEQVERTVAEYVETVASLDPLSQRYLRTVASIDRLGQREFTATAAMSGRTLERRFEVERNKLAAKAPLARQLAELRKVVEELSPPEMDLERHGSRGPFGLGPQHDEADELGRYFEHFARSRAHVEQLLQTIAEGRLALERDNALLGQEQVSLATVMDTLRERAYLAARLDEALTARIDTVAQADPDRADCLRADVLHAIRRRRQEILTQLAVAMQGYTSLRIVEDTNTEVARAIETATTTTAAALRTAVMVAQAVAGQRIALEQMEIAHRATAAIAGQADALQDHLRDSGARMAALQGAWAEVYGALDRLDARKEQARRALSSASGRPAGPGPDAADPS
jgi:uncharacterized protein YaaN involved in tellurite resistance